MIEEKHRGHEAMHAEMILILFVAALVAQVILVIWKLRHKKSYHVIHHSVDHVYSPLIL